MGLHEVLLDILKANELVYAPTLMDAKEIPDKIDVAIIEGGVRTEHEVETTKKIRERSSILIALGSCACFGGVPGLANLKEGDELLNRIYSEQKGTIASEMPTVDKLRRLRQGRLQDTRLPTRDRRHSRRPHHTPQRRHTRAQQDRRLRALPPREDRGVQQKAQEDLRGGRGPREVPT